MNLNSFQYFLWLSVLVLLTSGSSFASPQKPLHEWDFTKASGETISDTGSGQLALKLQGELKSSSGEVKFTGNMGDAGVIETLEVNSLKSAFTFAIWVKPNAIAKAKFFGAPYEKDPTWNTPQPGLQTSSSGVPQFGSWGNEATEKMQIEGKTSLVAGVWTYLVVTYNQEKMVLYVDGKVVNEKEFRFSHSASSKAFGVGRIKEAERFYDGKIGTLVIDAEAWSEQQVLEAFEKKSKRFVKEAGSAVKKYPSQAMAFRRDPKEKWSEDQVTPFSLLPDYPRQASGVKLDAYGGTMERSEKATGFFRAQKIGERWWIITPEGHPMINMAVVAVSSSGGKTAKESFPKVFGDTATWVNQTTGQLKELGFNGVGAWSDVSNLSQANEKIALCVIKNFMADFAKSKKLNATAVGHSGYINEAIPVFDPDFPEFARTYAEKELAIYKDNPSILGIFSDNELQTPKLKSYLELSESVPAQNVNRLSAKAWLAEATGKADADKKDITAVLEAKFHAFVLAKYYEIVSAAIRKTLPHHMYIGSRLHSTQDKENPFLWKAIGPFLDIVSVNYYGDWTPDPGMVPKWTVNSGKPVIITEWYVKGDDVGFPNTTGAGWIVKTQKDRGIWYQHFALGLLTMKNVVGWHWFKYMDNDPADPNADASNRDSNKGIIKTDWTIYTEVADLMKDFNQEVYPLVRWLDAK